MPAASFTRSRTPAQAAPSKQRKRNSPPKTQSSLSESLDDQSVLTHELGLHAKPDLPDNRDVLEGLDSPCSYPDTPLRRRTFVGPDSHVGGTTPDGLYGAIAEADSPAGDTCRQVEGGTDGRLDGMFPSQDVLLAP